jgi:hypothetical protein
MVQNIYLSQRREVIRWVIRKQGHGEIFPAGRDKSTRYQWFAGDSMLNLYWMIGQETMMAIVNARAVTLNGKAIALTDGRLSISLAPGISFIDSFE